MQPEIVHFARLQMILTNIWRDGESCGFFLVNFFSLIFLSAPLFRSVFLCTIYVYSMQFYVPNSPYSVILLYVKLDAKREKSTSQ